MQQMQKMRGYRVVECFHLNPPPIARIVVPVEQHRTQRRQQRIRNRARSRLAVVRGFRQHAAQHRDSGSQHVHRMRRGRQQLQSLFDCRGQAAQRPQACFVPGQLRRVGQLAMHQQVGHFLILAMRGQFFDVVAAIMQIVAAVPHRADCRVAGGRAGKRH